MKELKESILKSVGAGKEGMFDYLYNNFENLYDNRGKTGMDMLGNPLSVGDYIVYFWVGFNDVIEKRFGVIWKMNAKSCRFKYMHGDAGESGMIAELCNCIKITTPDNLTNRLVKK